MNDSGEPLNETARDLFSRENVVACPHDMAVSLYLAKHYGLPNYAWGHNDILYHYTDASGLLGIISSHRLWATDVAFLNDPSEGKLFPQHLLELMRQKEGGLTPLEARIVDQMTIGLKQKAFPSHRYSVSFCEDGDLLGQWRGYGSFGAGYAVGFDLTGLPHPQIGHPVKVKYGFQNLDALALDLLSIYVEASNNWHNHTFDELCQHGAGALRTISLGFKDISYADERETRILTSANYEERDLFKEEAPLRFRSRGSDIIPYTSLYLDLITPDKGVSPLPIRKIITGPGVDFDRNRKSLEFLLSSNDYNNVEIVQSKIPFRG